MMKNACKINTFPQLPLRAVKIKDFGPRVGVRVSSMPLMYTPMESIGFLNDSKTGAPSFDNPPFLFFRLRRQQRRLV